MNQAKTTTDHKEIQMWIEARKGRPTVAERRKLAFFHQDKTVDGGTSRFSKFVHREN